MSSRKRLVLAVAGLAGGVMLTGCGGVRATHGVSPATFLLPGLIQNTPARPAPGEPASQPVIAMISPADSAPLPLP